MRQKLAIGIKAHHVRVIHAEAFDPHKIDLAYARLAPCLPPGGQSPGQVRNDIAAIHQHHGLTRNPDITRITQVRRQITGKVLMLRWIISLRDEHLLITAIPAPRPVFIGPA